MDKTKLAVRRLNQMEGKLLDEAVELMSDLLSAIDDMHHGNNGTINKAYEKAEAFLDDHGLN